jgi:hypothetical protein
MMQPIEIIEIDQDSCSLSYGLGACEARLGTTGDNKCFNTIGTCQYLQAYSNTTKTLKFCTNQQVIPADHLPFLEKVSITSAEINPGGANKSQSPLGKRATVSASFLDAPSTDRFTDNYAEQRRTGEAQASGIGYNPEDISTFWRKWKARNKYYLYRNMRYITAMIDDSGILHDVRTRHYVITSFSGPSAKGGVNIGGKDILELLSKDKAEAPFVSQGKLLAEITESQTSITLTPSGIGAKYPASGFVSIGNEICSFTRTGDSMTLVRALYSTEASSHKEGDTVQLCLNFVGQDVRQICETLLTDYAKIPVEFLALAGWQAEIDNGNLPYRFSALIAKPEKALDLISELMEQGYFYLWFDELDSKVKMQSVRRVSPNEDIASLDYELNFLKDSISISDKPDQIITRVVVNYGIINPLNGAKESNNFSIAELVVDLENEDDAHARISNTKTIYSRWMHAEHGAAARELGQRLLDRYKVPPVNMSFSLASKDSFIKLADFVRVKSPYQVDEIGNFAHLDGQIISAKEREAQHRFDYTMTQFAFEKAVDSRIKNIEISDDLFNVNVLTLYNNTISSPLNAGDTLNIIVRKNVIIGSRSNTVEAMYFPNFGVQNLTINLIVEEGAFVVGKGGDGASVDLFTLKNAGDGGNAIKARNKINIDNSGTIGGGGGGGGGVTGVFRTGEWANGMAGGGGAGQAEGITGYIKGTLYTGAAFTISDRPNGSTTLGAKPHYATNVSGTPLEEISGLAMLTIDYPDGNGGGLGEDGKSAKGTMDNWNAGTPIGFTFNLATEGKGGKAIDGASFVTYTKKGTIKGAEVN